MTHDRSNFGGDIGGHSGSRSGRDNGDWHHWVARSLVDTQFHVIRTLAGERGAPVSQEAKVRTRPVLTRVGLSRLENRVIDMDAERFDLGVVEQILPILAVDLVTALDLFQVPVRPEQSVLKHGQRKGVFDNSHLKKRILKIELEHVTAVTSTSVCRLSDPSNFELSKRSCLASDQ